MVLTVILTCKSKLLSVSTGTPTKHIKGTDDTTGNLELYIINPQYLERTNENF